MQEIIEQVINYLRGVWRYRWVAMALTWVIALGGWVTVAKLPEQYSASARVYVDTESLLRPLLRGLAVQTNVEQRVQLMTRTLLSRPNLEKIMRMSDLDVKVHSTAQKEAMLDSLGGNIKLISNAREKNLYTITYENSDPEMAKRVVQSLLTTFVEGTLGDARDDSNNAQKFLKSQIEEYEKRLMAAEDRIKEFKRKNVGMMPSSGQDYFAKLQAAQLPLEEARLKLREVTKRRDELRRQLQGEEPVFGLGPGLSRGRGGFHPLDGKIEALRSRQDELLLKYTSHHPDVVALEDKIISLEEQKEKELAAMPGMLENSPELEKNPVFQSLKIALGAAEVEVASLTVRVKDHQGKLDKLKRLVNTIPEIEAQLKRLNRDYALDKNNYDAMVARLESAMLAESAGKTGEDVKFKVVDPPRAPHAPSGPNRILLSSAALIAGMLAGIAVAFLLSQLRPAIYSLRTLEQATGYPVFGSVSRLWTADLLFKKRLEFGVFAFVGCVLLMVFGGVYYMQGNMIELINRMMMLGG